MRKRIGIWGGSYGGYLAALALGRNSDVFAAGVDIHGVHDRVPAVSPEQLAHALVGDGITEADYEQALKVAYESSPISSVATWKSPVLLIHADDDRNVQFHQTVDLKRRLEAKGVQRRGARDPGRHPRFSALANLADRDDGDRRVFREAVHGPLGRIKPVLIDTPQLSSPRAGGIVRWRISTDVMAKHSDPGEARVRPAVGEDGVRVLVDRLWPRGLPKARARDRSVAEGHRARAWRCASGSTAIRRAGREFKRRYAEELDALRAAKRRGRGADRRRALRRVTLLFGARDEQHNTAVALQHYLRRT